MLAVAADIPKQTITMNDLKSLSLELSEFINKSSREVSETKIVQHILDISSVSPLESVRIPDGLTWFGVTEPLSAKITDGRIVVLDFFTYCCMNCIHILPHLKKLEVRYKDEPGLVVIGVHSPKFDNEKDKTALENAIVKLDISHPVVNDTETILWNNLDINCWPTLLILDPTGKPIFILPGEGRELELNIFIATALDHFKPHLSQSPLPLCRYHVASGFLSYPGRVTGNADGLLAVADSGHHRIVLVKPSGDVVDVVGGPTAGNADGSFGDARFRDPQGLAFHGNDKLYVADCANHLIRMVDLRLRLVVTVVGTGEQGVDFKGGKLGTGQEICSPWGLCVVRSPPQEIAGKIEQPKNITVVTSAVGPPPPPPPLMTGKPAMVVSASTDVLLIAMSGLHQIWAYFLEDTVWWKAKVYKKGTCVAVAGAGDEKNRNNRFPMMAGFAQPSGLAYCDSAVFIADSESSSVRKMDMATGAVEPLVGGHVSPDNLFSFGDVDGVGRDAQLQHPLDVAWDEVSQTLLVADTYNQKLKTVDIRSMKCVTCPTRLRFNDPGGVYAAEHFVYVVDTNTHRLLRLTRDTWQQSTVEFKQSSYSGKSRIRVVWETTVPISPRGSDVMLTVSLDDTTAGRWYVAADCPTSVRTAVQAGQVDIGRIEIRFFTDATDEAAFDLDLSFCRDDACYLRYYRLLVRPVICQTADSITTLFFTPIIGNQ